MVRNYNQHNWEIFELRSSSNSKKEIQVETNVHFCKLSDLIFFLSAPCPLPLPTSLHSQFHSHFVLFSHFLLLHSHICQRDRQFEQMVIYSYHLVVSFEVPHQLPRMCCHVVAFQDRTYSKEWESWRTFSLRTHCFEMQACRPNIISVLGFKLAEPTPVSFGI